MEGLSTSSPLAITSIFDRVSVLNDPIRCRVLLLLESHELAVSEICGVLQLPQSTVSRHLKTLADDGWLQVRREATSRHYSASTTPQDDSAQRLWELLREEVATSHSARQDRTRLAEILSQRRSRSQEFFSKTAGQWAELRRDLFGDRFDLQGLIGLVEEDWIVGDLGCGAGQITQSLAPFVQRVIAVDESEAMLAAAAVRLDGLDNVELRRGQLEQLPLTDGSLDATLLVMVLHHLADPAAVLLEASRALRPGGKLLIVDILPHEHEEYRIEMGHIWLGFAESQLAAWLKQAGLSRIHFHELRADPDAKGPTLFAATARVAESHASQDQETRNDHDR